MNYNTTYYWKIVASDGTHATEGNIWSFTTHTGGFICGDILTDFEGNNYNTVLINNQCWMEENLKATAYSNGTPIPNVTDNTEWYNLTSSAYAWYDNNILWKNEYGALYNWFATVDANGLCPTGWHVPTNDEWTALTDFIGGVLSPHGNELKSCRQVNSPLGGNCNTLLHPRWDEHITHYGTDDYGFSGLPGGIRIDGGIFSALGTTGDMWTSTENSSSNAWFRILGHDDDVIYVYSHLKQSGFSVRCIRD